MIKFIKHLGIFSSQILTKVYLKTEAKMELSTVTDFKVSDKVVLHLHSTTNTFHFQGKEAISWFQEIFKTFAKQLHDECKLCVFSNQESSKTENSVNTNISGGQKSNTYVIF